MKASFICVILALSQFCYSQKQFRLCADFKTGVSVFSINQTRFDDKANPPVGSHGSAIYPNIHMTTQPTLSPYFSLGLATRFSRAFELVAGISYEHFTTSLEYINYDGLYSSSTHYIRTETKAKGEMNANVFRIELSPVLRAGNTKFIFGLNNFSIYKMETKNLKGETKTYDVISKQKNQGDSIVTLLSQENVHPIFKISDGNFLPFTIGIEQEIPISKIRLLLGSKVMFSGLNFAPKSFCFYLGTRLSKAYTSRKKKDTSIE